MPLKAETELQQYRWNNRVVLVFFEANQSAQMDDIKRIWEQHSCAIQERDMIIGYLSSEGPSSLNGQTLSKKESLALRDEYNADGEALAVILIGKDAGIKYRDNRFDIKTIFNLIDGMPMRKREMSEQSSRCKKS